MSIQFQLRRGTTSQIAAITPAAGEILYDTSKHSIVVGDGTQAGGYPFPAVNASGWLGFGTASPAAPIHIIQFATGGIAIQCSDSLTDATQKHSQICINHYTNAQKPITIFDAVGGLTDNIIHVGGNNANTNAATIIKFFTAANNTTLTGTEAARVNASQQFLHISGSAAVPAISFISDTNTGFFDVAADIIGFTCGGVEMARLNGSGHFLIGTTVDNGHLTVGGKIMPEADNTRDMGSATFRWANGYIAQLIATKARITTSQTPATSGAAGTQGDFAWDTSYFYICTATNTWRRVAHASW